MNINPLQSLSLMKKLLEYTGMLLCHAVETAVVTRFLSEQLESLNLTHSATEGPIVFGFVAQLFINT